MKPVQEILSAKCFKAALVPSLVVAALGVALWIYQGVAGMGVTNMSDSNPWGLYLMAFMFTVGVAVGGLLVSSLVQLSKGSEFKGLSKLGAWVAISAAVLSFGFVIVDLGGPLRVWELFVYSNLSSPLMWDIFALPLFSIVAIAQLWTLMRFDAGKASEKAVRIVSFVALVASIALCVVDAWIFGLLPGRALWNTALLGPWFLAAAVASGLAVVMLLVKLTEKSDAFALPADAMSKMGRILMGAVVVDLLCLVCDLMVGAYAGAAHADTVAVLMFGQLAPVFWIEVACSVAAIALLACVGKGSATIIAPVLVLVSIFCKRIQFMISGFLSMQMPYPGVETAGTIEVMPLTAPLYCPSLVEMGVTVAVIALGVALLAVGLRMLPLAAAKN
ncbi:NrfD/PsrC family molybdoenzyme membrane anchor subunit [Slackia piriformis]|uniref:NrfD/PsrC family molybdoenzyme membrane anchor subunit n=1 Tax=Slackia piriformis TaxID=626934 RepID=UPI0026DAD4D9|nr:NrfD/PsrC family molybdoenzyme membrane anchor subunit [Slackia piriformis]MDO5024677.1 polysulfide reductase NrfD [Slackia piriformis]